MKQFTIKSLKCIFILVFLVALPSLALLADNWNTGSGGNSSRNCRTSESGPVTADLLWENGVNAVISQQPVIDGDIVVMSRIVSISNIPGSSVIVAQSLVTGDTLWTKKLPLDFPATDWGSRVSAFRNGVVYATRSGNSNSSFMYALDVLTGEIIWKSQGLISESSTESCAFASNGDLIVGNFNSIIRINALDGSTVWETPRVCPTSNGQEISVYGEKGYYWEANFYGPVVHVINLETGQYLYSSESLSAGYIQQLCLMIGPDGTIYAPRSMNNGSTDYMVALRDNGSSFTELWRTPVGFIPMSTSGLGPDGSIYTYNNAGEVIRLDPQDGSIMNTSVSIFTSIGSGPRMAIDKQGHIYVTNGESDAGEVFCFNADLTLIWSDNIPNLFNAGPAIGDGGTLVIAAAGTNVRAYEGLSVSVPETGMISSLSIYPNPTADVATLKINPSESGNMVVSLSSQAGKALYSDSFKVENHKEFATEISLKNYEPGVYILKIAINNTFETRKIIKF